MAAAGGGVRPFVVPDGGGRGHCTAGGSACRRLQEKEAQKQERDEKEAKYKYAMVDGRQETVGACGEGERGQRGGLCGCSPACAPHTPDALSDAWPRQPHQHTLTHRHACCAAPRCRWATSVWSPRACSAGGASTPRWAASRSASTHAISPSTSAPTPPCPSTPSQVRWCGGPAGGRVDGRDYACVQAAAAGPQRSSHSTHASAPAAPRRRHRTLPPFQRPLPPLPPAPCPNRCRPALEGGPPRPQRHLAGLLEGPSEHQGIQVRVPGRHLDLEERQ